MPLVLLLMLFTVASRAEDNSYAKQIADFRQEHESSIRKDTGPLLLRGHINRSLQVRFPLGKDSDLMQSFMLRTKGVRRAVSTLAAS
jgi:hypothetical protein